MTDALKKQIEDAARDVRTAKDKWRSANESILSHQASIGTCKSVIASNELAIQSSYEAIESAAKARDRADEEFLVAQDRLSFFNRELISHPYLAA